MICIIPARKGSERVKNKNFRKLGNKPLIDWTIEEAINSNIFKKVYISTDDVDFEQRDGTETLFRDGYSDNLTTVQEACIMSLEQIKEEKGEEYKTVTMLLPTCPLRTSTDIVKAYHCFRDDKHSFLISANRYAQNPYWAHSDKDKPIFYEALKERSQDLPRLKCPNGAIWIANIAKLIKNGTFYNEDTKLFLIPTSHSIDIDTEEDFRTARILSSYTQRSNKNFEKVLRFLPILKKKIAIKTEELKEMKNEEYNNTLHGDSNWSTRPFETKIIMSEKRLKRDIRLYQSSIRALKQLKTEKGFDVFYSYYLEGKSISDINLKTGLAPSTISNHKNAILEKFKILIGGDDLL